MNILQQLQIKVIPNAKKSEFVGYRNNVLTIRIKAPAIDGKANKELIDFLSKELKIAKGDIKIIKGEKSNTKLLTINYLKDLSDLIVS